MAANMEGQYVCRARNEFHDITETIQIVMEDEPQPPPSPPRVYGPSSEVIFVGGRYYRSLVPLDCTFIVLTFT